MSNFLFNFLFNFLLSNKVIVLMMGRQSLLWRRNAGFCVVLLLLMMQQGCGFHLRGSAELPPQLSPLLVRESDAGTEIVPLLNRAISRNKIEVAKDEQYASAILTIHREDYQRRVLTVSSAGNVQEFELSYRVNYSLMGQQKRPLLSSQWIKLNRDLRFDETAVLAKSSEESQLKKDMVNDAVQQILRRLQKLNLNQTLTDEEKP